MVDPPQSPHAPPLVRFQRPELPSAQKIEGYFRQSRTQRWFANEGPCFALLQDRLSAFLGEGTYCLPTANATSALMIALRALCRRGGEVLLPSFTFVATAAAARWGGLEPVFVDVDPDHWHLEPVNLRKVLGERGDAVSAVVACSTFGCPPPVAVSEGWRRACGDAGVPLLVDSAAGFGAINEQGNRLGRQGDVEVFSFHATKPFAIGEGGLAVTSDPTIYARMRSLANFGLDDQRVPREAVGMNAKMSELHAATALAVLDDFEVTIASRRDRAAELQRRLEPCGFTFQTKSGGSVWQFVPALAQSHSHRQYTLACSTAARVELRTYHLPLHTTPAFSGCLRADSLAVTEDLGARIVSLPMAADLTGEEIDRICAAVPRGALISNASISS